MAVVVVAEQFELRAEFNFLNNRLNVIKYFILDFVNHLDCIFICVFSQRKHCCCVVWLHIYLWLRFKLWFSVNRFVKDNFFWFCRLKRFFIHIRNRSRRCHMCCGAAFCMFWCRFKQNIILTYLKQLTGSKNFTSIYKFFPVFVI